MSDPFFIVEPQGEKVPLIVSSPHSGTAFPDELKAHFRPEMAAQPDDTDWFIHELYDFVGELGVTMIHAKYSRWVIDLNRNPESVPLYADGRIITELVPKTDFFGNALYADAAHVPDDAEIERRKELYYRPYYRKIENLLRESVARFGQVLLWDAHSIRRIVPTIQTKPFPDFILGDADEKSADASVIEIALGGLKGGKFGVNHNSPFKGGQITRFFGKPQENVHALQLEMAKDNYMNDDELTFSEARASEVRGVLRPVFENLIAHLTR